MSGAEWEECRLVVRCDHEPELVKCHCGIYGLYNPVNAYQNSPVLAMCSFYGRMVIASAGVRSEVADIEVLWLIRDALHGEFEPLLSDQTRVKIEEEVAYKISAQYGLPVTVLARQEIGTLPLYAPPGEIPARYLVGHFREGESQSAIPDVIQGWLTVKERSRLERSLEHAASKEDGVVTAGELRGLHCKVWQDCIHGRAGYAGFIHNAVDVYHFFELVKRGKYRITDRGYEILRSGRLQVNQRLPVNVWYHQMRFIPTDLAETDE